MQLKWQWDKSVREKKRAVTVYADLKKKFWKVMLIKVSERKLTWEAIWHSCLVGAGPEQWSKEQRLAALIAEEGRAVKVCLGTCHSILTAKTAQIKGDISDINLSIILLKREPFYIIIQMAISNTDWGKNLIISSHQASQYAFIQTFQKANLLS